MKKTTETDTLFRLPRNSLKTSSLSPERPRTSDTLQRSSTSATRPGRSSSLAKVITPVTKSACKSLFLFVALFVQRRSITKGSLADYAIHRAAYSETTTNKNSPGAVDPKEVDRKVGPDSRKPPAPIDPSIQVSWPRLRFIPSRNMLTTILIVSYRNGSTSLEAPPHKLVPTC